jgi:DNA polymerase-1
LSRKDASDFVAAYYARFPGVKRFLDGIRVQAANDGYVETMMGRKRYFPGLGRQMNHLIRDREEREAINAPVQGTAADILKIAMIRLPSALDQAGLKSKILLQVHDELLLECASEELDETRKIVQSVMESAVSLSIPLLTEARSGINWGALTTVEN